MGKKGDRVINVDLKKRRGIKLAIIVVICILVVFLLFVFYQKKISNSATGKVISDFSDSSESALVTVNFSDDVGIIGDDFYGANVHESWLRNGMTIDVNGDGIRESLANTSWNRQMFLNAGLRYAREDAGLNSCYWVNSSNVSQWFRTCNLTDLIEEYSWARYNGVRILNVLSYMPVGLRNTNAECSTDPSKCQPLDYDIWGKIIVDYINATTNNGEFLPIVDYEIWNEPDLHQFLLPNLHIHGTQEASNIYVSLYNSSYTNIKMAYPNARIIGPSSAQIDIYTNITFSFLSNFSNKMDGISLHDYSPVDSSSLITRIDKVLSYCKTYNANCSRILVSEFNYKNSSNVGGGMELSNSKLSEFYGDIFADGLNMFPSNLSLIIYQWSEQYSYNKNPSHYPEYPSRWSMISQAGLDNPNPTFYPSYNITKNFATYHSAGSMVVKSNSSISNIKVVASKKNNSQYITIINAGNDTNVSIKIYENASTGIRDLETGENHTIINGIVDIGTINQYQIRYFVNFD